MTTLTTCNSEGFVLHLFLLFSYIKNNYSFRNSDHTLEKNSWISNASTIIDGSPQRWSLSMWMKTTTIGSNKKNLVIASRETCFIIHFLIYFQSNLTDCWWNSNHANICARYHQICKCMRSTCSDESITLHFIFTGSLKAYILISITCNT